MRFNLIKLGLQSNKFQHSKVVFYPISESKYKKPEDRFGLFSKGYIVLNRFSLYGFL